MHLVGVASITNLSSSTLIPSLFLTVPLCVCVCVVYPLPLPLVTQEDWSLLFFSQDGAACAGRQGEKTRDRDKGNHSILTI